MQHKKRRRPRLSLAQKLACLTAGLGLFMTLAFTLLNAAQMRAETTRNYHHMLTAIMNIRETLLTRQYAALLEWMDMRERRDLARSKGENAPLPAPLQRMLDENTGPLPLDAQLVFLNTAGEVLAPAALRNQSLPISVSPALLQAAAASSEIRHWSGPRGAYLYRVFYFAPQAWYVACLLPLAALEDTLARRTRQMLGTGLAFTLTGLVLALWLGRRVTAPLRQLDRAARILPTLDMHTGQAKDAPCAALPGLPPLPLTRGDEVGALARSFDHMVRQLHDNARHMLAMSKEQARLQSELQLARAIQEGMLPREFPRGNGLDVHGLVLPAREVGGDFFDAFMLDDRTLCFAIGDVSDKGVPAALFMSMILCLTRTLLRRNAHGTSPGNPDPAAVLTSINEALCRDNPRSMFATMILGVLDCRSGRMVWANAGHPPPLRLRRSPGPASGPTSGPASGPDGHALPQSAPLCVEELPNTPGPRALVAGAFEDVVYTPSTCTLAPGDGVLLYTDGITEALRGDGLRFGELHSHLDALPQASAAVNSYIIEKLQSFTLGHTQSDDITLLNFFWGAPLAQKNNTLKNSKL